MICNMGPRDRILRMILGFALIIFYGTVGVWLSLVGLFLFITGFFRWCPFYLPFKLNTK